MMMFDQLYSLLLVDFNLAYQRVLISDGFINGFHFPYPHRLIGFFTLDSCLPLLLNVNVRFMVWPVSAMVRFSVNHNLEGNFSMTRSPILIHKLTMKKSINVLLTTHHTLQRLPQTKWSCSKMDLWILQQHFGHEQVTVIHGYSIILLRENFKMNQIYYTNNR